MQKMSRLMIRHKLYILFLLCLSLVACSNNSADMIELQDYVNKTVNRPPGAVDAMPEFVSYESFTYSAASLRGPFNVPVDVTAAARAEVAEQVKPDENRSKEALEGFSVGTLTMVGTLSKNNTLWALVQDEVSKIHRVMVGNYIGKNHGRIVSTAETQIDFVEIVPNGNGGWVERPQTITLER